MRVHMSRDAGTGSEIGESLYEGATLATDRRDHRRDAGRTLFRAGAKSILQAAEARGVRGMFVHALSDEARPLCLALGS
jgi:hypothetical protein